MFRLLLLLSLSARADSDMARLASELSALSAAAPASPAPKAKGVIVRFPNWELGAVRNVEMAAGPIMRLSDRDIADGKTVFSDSIDYYAVRMVVAEDYLVDFAQVWGETIRVPPGGMTRATLIHELTHVWQFQTSGLGYISNSLGAQVCALVKKGDRDRAYDYVADPKKSFFDYSAEQQAEIVEHWFSRPALRKTEHYARWIGEVRARKFVPGDRKKLYEEKAAGLMPPQYMVPPLTGFEPDRVMPSVPQLEVRF